MSKVKYINVHTGQEGEIESDKYEAFARRVNRGRGIIRKIGEVKETPKAKTPPEAKKSEKSTPKKTDEK